MEQYQAFIDEVGTRIAESPQPKLEPGSKLGKQDELLLDIQRDVERTFGGLAWFGGRPCDQDVAGVEDPFWARVDLLEALDAARAQELAGQQSEQSSQEARHMPTLSDRRPVTRRQALLRPLATYATLNPGLSYVQGMNSLIGVLYWIFGHMSITAPSNPDSETSSPAVAEFQAEASAFFALGAILSQLRDLYVLSMDGNGAGTGLGATLVRFTSLLTWLDPTVAASLESRQIEPALYCFRWLTTLFANEVSYRRKSVPQTRLTFQRTVSIARPGPNLGVSARGIESYHTFHLLILSLHSQPHHVVISGSKSVTRRGRR